MVRKGGFEPPRLSAPPPQDGVSASSTTSADFALLPLFCAACWVFEGAIGQRRRELLRPFTALPSLFYTRGCGWASSCAAAGLPRDYEGLMKFPRVRSGEAAV